MQNGTEAGGSRSDEGGVDLGSAVEPLAMMPLASPQVSGGVSGSGEFHQELLFGTVFEVIPSSGVDQDTGMNVAIKKVMRPFSTPILAKRTYRELMLLKNLRHENILSLYDVFISPSEDVYFVTELLGTDLHRLLTSRPLEKQFVQYFLYQILRGLKKPSNILVNENCDLKIGDFGLARVTENQMTGK
ncbi:Mitogen-activated protein kinase 13 [Cladochytrium tenue]|nr:Mitogen-activated protein kinase 13 [Cladochytrium tenue]